jgi:nucleoside-diphosphate-sugar epimerase
MTAIVLGSSGFVGHALVRYLEAQGEAVLGHSSTTLDLRAAGSIKQLGHDADDLTTLHLVAALTPERGVGLAGLADNLAMVLNVGRFVERTRLRKCVYFSSDAVYGMRPEPVDESAPIDAGNLYALSKLNGERILEHAAKASGVPLVILRVTGVYGPGDPHNAYGPNRFVRAIAEGQPVQLFGQGEEERDHIYIDDVARIAAALGDGPSTGVFNLATGTSRTFASIVQDLRELTPVPFAVEHRPRSGPITHRSFQIDRLREAFSDSDSDSDSDPHLSFTPFADGLARTLAAGLSIRHAAVAA